MTLFRETPRFINKGHFPAHRYGAYKSSHWLSLLLLTLPLLPTILIPFQATKTHQGDHVRVFIKEGVTLWPAVKIHFRLYLLFPVLNLG